ncbi:hypothetical protein GcM3_213031, partial [Golovinomyces cichoracearum]
MPISHKKKCFMCGEPGRWSSHYLLEEKKAAFSRLQRQTYFQGEAVTLNYYQAFPAEWEGVEGFTAINEVENIFIVSLPWRALRSTKSLIWHQVQIFVAPADMDIDSDPTINDVESLPLPTQSVSISTPHEDSSIFKIPLQPNTSQSHNTQLNPPTTNYSCDFSSDQIFFADQSQKHIFQTPKHTVETTVKNCKCPCPEHDKIAKQNDEQSKKGWTNYFSNTNTKFNSSKEALYHARDNILDAYKLTSDRKYQEKILDLLNIFRQLTETGQLPQTKPTPKSNLFPAKSLFAEYLNVKELSAGSAEPALETPSKHPTSPKIVKKTYSQ